MTNKQKVINLFESNKILYFSDISHKLNMDIEKVVKICRKLLKEGKIRVAKKRGKK